MVKSECKYCKNEIIRNGFVPGVFCNLTCKGEYQRLSKPVTKEWLEQKYLIEGLGTYEIGKLVNRDPKRVYEWLIDFKIPTRDRSESIKLMNKREDIRKMRSESLTGREVTPKTREKISKARSGKTYPNLSGEKNGMYGRKGDKSPNWKGGTTPERQKMYSSLEWKGVIKEVWKRDKGYCQNCYKKSNGKDRFDIHHISSFSLYEELRCDLNNLVLLCDKCHYWVHSNDNKEKRFIKE